MSLGLVYLAAPIQMYDSPVYERHLTGLLAQGWAVADVRHMYASDDDWRQRWPREHPRYDALAFLDCNGWIGRATGVELADMQATGRPVWWARCCLHERCTDYRLGPPGGDWAWWRTVTCR